MKRVLLPLFFALFLLPLAACDSSDDDGDGGGGSPGSIPGSLADATISWRANGTTYEADGDVSTPLTGFAVSTYTNSGVGGVPLLTLNATSATSASGSGTIAIAANGVGDEGTFPISVNEGSIMTFVLTEISGTSAVVTPYVGTSGSITVSELTETGARGTFSFEGVNQDDETNTVSITNGRFAVLFTR